MTESKSRGTKYSTHPYNIFHRSIIYKNIVQCLKSWFPLCVGSVVKILYCYISAKTSVMGVVPVYKELLYINCHYTLASQQNNMFVKLVSPFFRTLIKKCFSDTFGLLQILSKKCFIKKVPSIPSALNQWIDVPKLDFWKFD